MKFNLIRKYSFVAILLCLITACSNELEKSSVMSSQEEGKQISVNIMPKLVVGDGNEVSQLRVIIFATRTSNPYGSRELISNQLVDINGDYTTTTYIGYNDFYVIGNETVDLSNVKTPEDLENIQMNTESSLNASKFVFFKKLLNVNVRNKNEIYLEGESTPVSKLEIKLQRVIAKLSVNFDLSTEIYEGQNPTNEYVNFESMELLRIPKYSYLISKTYKKDAGFLDNRVFSLTNSSTKQNHFTWSSGEIYLPEYLPENDDYKMELRIKGTLNGITHIYTLPIGDAMNSVDSHSTAWNITRNRHYTLNVKAITGRGEESLEVKAGVAGWTEINVPIDITGSSFLAVNKKSLEVKSLRFYTYVRFACNDEITVELPSDVTISNQLKMIVEYDDTTKKSGRVGFRRGNWNTGNDITYVATLKSGSASIKLNLQLFKSEVVSVGTNPVTWSYAMGYPDEANTISADVYNDKLYKKATTETGCRAYYPKGVDPNDPIKGKGCWRLATIRENWVLNSSKKAWCIEELSPKTAYVSYGYNDLVSDYKVVYRAYSYNCALDVRPPELSDFIVSSEDKTGVKKEDAESKCTELGKGWRLPTGQEMNYVFLNAGTNGLPNNFFSDSYWGKNENNTFIVATMDDPDGSATTEALLKQTHAVRCVKPRY